LDNAAAMAESLLPLAVGPRMTIGLRSILI
jgi:hypothetical protein